MPTTYKIRFKNDHGADGDYSFCTEKPMVNKNTSEVEVLINVWIKRFVPKGNDMAITTTTEYYAWCGTLPSKPAEGINIDQGHSESVQLGTSEKKDGDSLKMVLKKGVPTFEDDRAKTANPGCFAITQGTDFTKDKNVVIGMALKDDKGNVSPAAMILADTNAVTNIQPVVKFYVSKTSSQVGEIVNYQTYTDKAGVIDFTTGKGQGKTTANVTHKANGEFDVTYDD